MILAKRIGQVLVSAVIAFLCAGSMAAQSRPNALRTTRQVPDAFGTQDYTVTTISATSFYPETSGSSYITSGSWGRFQCNGCPLSNFFVGLDLPAGAVIDFIGLNSTTNVPAIIGAELARRDKFGNLGVIGGIDSTVHADWDTDFNANPIGFLWQGRTGEALVLHVQFASDPNPQFFGWVEVWWRRSVSPAPATAIFTDVPTTHTYFRAIEALAASGITAGCGGGNFCPNQNVTRGEMAAFLARALGLHWPN